MYGEILFIATLVAIACVLPGIFLVLRGVALMSDAISHAILLGIALMFLVVGRLDSPLLLIGAVLTGVVTVFCTELLINTRFLKKDAAIGMIFPLFFSLGVIIISRYARNVHLDTDMILLGEIALAPFNRVKLWGYDWGPYAVWQLTIVILINMLFLYVWYKELVVALFDSVSATVWRLRPLLLYYGLMTVTSITAVAAFDVVGAIVVVALMITPVACALLITRTMRGVIMSSVVCSIASAWLGYAVAICADVSIAGSMAAVAGLIFVILLIIAPRTGILYILLYERRRNRLIAQQVVADVCKELRTITLDDLHMLIALPRTQVIEIVTTLVANNSIVRNGNTLIYNERI